MSENNNIQVVPLLETENQEFRCDVCWANMSNDIFIYLLESLFCRPLLLGRDQYLVDLTLVSKSWVAPVRYLLHKRGWKRAIMLNLAKSIYIGAIKYIRVTEIFIKDSQVPVGTFHYHTIGNSILLSYLGDHFSVLHDTSCPAGCPEFCLLDTGSPRNDHVHCIIDYLIEKQKSVSYYLVPEWNSGLKVEYADITPEDFDNKSIILKVLRAIMTNVGFMFVTGESIFDKRNIITPLLIYNWIEEIWMEKGVPTILKELVFKIYTEDKLTNTINKYVNVQ